MPPLWWITSLHNIDVRVLSLFINFVVIVSIRCSSHLWYEYWRFSRLSRRPSLLFITYCTATRALCSCLLRLLHLLQCRTIGRSLLRPHASTGNSLPRAQRSTSATSTISSTHMTSTAYYIVHNLVTSNWHLFLRDSMSWCKLRAALTPKIVSLSTSIETTGRTISYLQADNLFAGLTQIGCFVGISRQLRNSKWILVPIARCVHVLMINWLVSTWLNRLNMRLLCSVLVHFL